jgi:two-component system chemotaxis response regulator CheB
MARHDVVVIGASGGGVEALTRLVAALPDDLRAAIFIVLHVNPDSPSFLPAILNRAGRLPVAHAVEGEPIRLGRVYVAPPGQQMYVHRGRISVKRGPPENLHRPAVDPLFRTAAHHYGRRVIGIVLTGVLDDGSAGLAAVKRGGGVAIVQDPNDAAFSAMPANAMERAAVDYCVRLDEIAPLLGTLIVSEVASPEKSVEVPLETVEEAEDRSEARRSEELGIPSPFTCPDCSGTLYEIHDGDVIRYRCRVGHGYTENSMVNAQAETGERALWTALRTLEERLALMRKLAGNARRRGHVMVAGMFEERAQQVDSDIEAIHSLIVAGRSFEPVTQDGT